MRMCVALAFLLLSVGGTQGQSAGDGGLGMFRERRAAGLDAPDGWLSLVALEWLQPGETTVGSAAGNRVRLQHGPAQLVTLRVAGGVVRVGPHEAGLRMNGKVISDGTVVGEDAALESGDMRLMVIRRGDRLYLRVKDAASPTRVGFRGLRWYAPEAKDRVVARWLPSAAEHTVTVPNVLGQISQERSPGVAEFALDGRTYRLEPIQEEPGSLFFVFRDLTSRSTTYGAGRFLVTALPDHGLAAPGTVVLDFNRAVNPPCAYTPYATCPLPPVGNRLAVAIAAGEKRYEP